MSDNFDDFEDIMHRNRGVFGDTEAALEPGLRAHDGVESQVLPEGAAFEFRCDGCGKMRRLILEYPELVALKFTLSPHVAFHGQYRSMCRDPSTWLWSKKDHAWRIKQQCSSCPWHYRLMINPSDPERMLGAARRANFINREGEAAVANHCNSVVQHMRAQRR